MIGWMIMKINKIIEYINTIYPNPRIELNYEKDYELLIAVMLSAQTTDKRVNAATDVLFKKYPSLEDLSNSDVKDLETIIKPIGTFRKKALNIKNIATKLLIEGGTVINNREFLESLDGVGRKTTNVVLAVLFDEQFIAVDTHIKRVSIRLGLANEEDTVLKIEKKLEKLLSGYKLNKIHHQILLFGRYYCKAKKPKCYDCKLINICKEKNKNFKNN